MFIIVGLGNPTLQYEGTRHNVGFDVIDAIADKYNISDVGAVLPAVHGYIIFFCDRIYDIEPYIMSCSFIL